MQALDIESLRSDLSGYQRECEVMSEHYADGLMRARSSLNEELATVRHKMNDAKLAAARSAVLQHQAERDVRPLVPLAFCPFAESRAGRPTMAAIPTHGCMCPVPAERIHVCHLWPLTNTGICAARAKRLGSGRRAISRD